MFDALRRRMRRLRRPVMAVVFGGDSIRYGSALHEGQTFCEPGLVARHTADRKILLNERAIGLYAENIAIGSLRGVAEVVRPFDQRMRAGAYTTRCVLRYLRERLAKGCDCRRPTRAALTARPALLDRLSDFVAGDARRAGIRKLHIVEEYVCLAAAVDADPAEPLLLVDIGATGTRTYACRGGVFIAEAFGETDAGGDRMEEALLSLFRQRYNVDIGRRTANRIIRELGDPAAQTIVAKGRDRSTGLPRAIEPARDDVASALTPLFREILAVCRAALDALHIDDPASIRVELAGGAARTAGLRTLLADALGARVALRADPGSLSLRGLTALARRRLLDRAAGLGHLSTCLAQ